MTFIGLQDKKLLSALLVVLALAIVYGRLATEKQRTAPLTYQRGAVAASPVRTGSQAPAAAEDPVRVLLGRKGERYPGLVRDLFRMENPAIRPKPVKAAPVAPVMPLAPERSPEEIAAEAARLDLSTFRFLGYLADRESESSLFLAKDGELYIVKSGDMVLKSYRVKSAERDFVVLRDSVTGVEVRVELSGSADQAPGSGAPLRQYP